ncbi:hypothetical protein, partial [Chitinophaga sp.]|uniref:hypothetical protein n=1 Tax=Chitinophaga sp. TaxID=1869181 RepID=UPI002F94410A
SMLWHNDTGALLVASMNKYQLVEAFNMQRDKGSESICFTPGFRLTTAAQLYLQTNDLRATVDYQETPGEIVFNTHSLLVNENQQPSASPACSVTYTFGDDALQIHGTAAHEKAVYSLPVISTHEEQIQLITPQQLEIHKTDAVVEITANVPIQLPAGRSFNFVPGMEAIPLLFETNHIDLKIVVRHRT